LKTFAKSEGTT